MTKMMPDFEENVVGGLKKELWEASDAAIDKVLEDYGIPSAGRAF